MIYLFIFFVDLIVSFQKGYMTQEAFLLMVVSLLAFVDYVRYVRLRSKTNE